MNAKSKNGTTTITLSIPTEKKLFFNELAQNGYNRSFLMLKMTKVLEELYKNRDKFPGGLHSEVDLLLSKIRKDGLEWAK